MDNIKQENIEEICFKVSKDIILPKFQNLHEDDIKYKNGSDIVTSVDIAAEKEIKKNLLKLIPSSKFIGEEEYALNDKIINQYNEENYCWTVDPIDGTTNFVKGRDRFAIMISLTFKEKILYSWIYKPLENTMCYAIFNEGAFINKERIQTSVVKSLKDAKGSISTKYWENHEWEKLKLMKNNFAEVSSYKCIGYEYVDIARGKRNFAILSKLSPWDHIPGILIVRESGGADLDFNQNQYNFTKKNKNLIVGNSKEFNLKILNIIGV